MLLGDKDENPHFPDEDTVAWRHSIGNQGPTAGGQWSKAWVLLSRQGNKQRVARSFTSSFI